MDDRFNQQRADMSLGVRMMDEFWLELGEQIRVCAHLHGVLGCLWIERMERILDHQSRQFRSADEPAFGEITITSPAYIRSRRGSLSAVWIKQCVRHVSPSSGTDGGQVANKDTDSRRTKDIFEA